MKISEFFSVIKKPRTLSPTVKQSFTRMTIHFVMVTNLIRVEQAVIYFHCRMVNQTLMTSCKEYTRPTTYMMQYTKWLNQLDTAKQKYEVVLVIDGHYGHSNIFTTTASLFHLRFAKNETNISC